MTEPPGARPINFGGHRLHLLPQRGVWWSAAGTLLVADLHFGKSAAFRAAGVPVPSGATSRDLLRLTQLFELLDCRRLIVLGDLVHAKSGKQPEVIDAVVDWRQRHRSIEMLLVNGNHDRSSGGAPSEWGLQIVDEPCIEHGLKLTHHARCQPDQPTLAGHVHPTVNLRDFDDSMARVPCFVVDPNCLLLPAFGSFTGGGTVYAQPERKIYIVAADRVIRLANLEMSKANNKTA